MAYNKEYSKNYYENNKERLLNLRKLRYINNKEKSSKQNKDYYFKNHDKELERKRKWRKDNPDYFKNKYQQNIIEDKKYSRDYRNSNLDKVRKKSREYHKKRKECDPLYRLIGNLRRRLNLSLKDISKSSKTLNLIGCSSIELRSHLQSLFLPGMSWSNYGKKGWHVDHIKPCASFNLSDSDQQKLCFHYTNLQPLWETDNLSKNSIYNGVHHKYKKKK